MSYQMLMSGTADDLGVRIGACGWSLEGLALSISAKFSEKVIDYRCYQ